MKLEEKQELLEIGSVNGRLERVISLMEGEIGVLQVEKRIRSPRQAPDGEDASASTI